MNMGIDKTWDSCKEVPSITVLASSLFSPLCNGGDFAAFDADVRLNVELVQRVNCLDIFYKEVESCRHNISPGTVLNHDQSCEDEEQRAFRRTSVWRFRRG